MTPNYGHSSFEVVLSDLCLGFKLPLDSLSGEVASLEFKQQKAGEGGRAV